MGPRLVYHGGIERRDGVGLILEAAARAVAGARRWKSSSPGAGRRGGLRRQAAADPRLRGRVSCGRIPYERVPELFAGRILPPPRPSTCRSTAWSSRASSTNSRRRNPLRRRQPAGDPRGLRAGEALIFPPGDAEALAAALARLAGERELRAALAAKLARRAAGLSLQGECAKILALFDELAEPRPIGSGPENGD